MRQGLKEAFIFKWQKYFVTSGYPVAYFYSNEVSVNGIKESMNQERCLIGNLNQVRDGKTFVYSSKSPGCAGGKRYAGFTRTLRPNFEYFLSCGLPGKMEGERYKKTPELVNNYLKDNPPFEAEGKYMVFKRWDKLNDAEQPAAVIFFATPDVLSGLFTLANYDSPDPHAVIAPMGSGCSSIIAYPMVEAKSDRPRCVLGMFDVSARPSVPKNTLTFTIPEKRFEQMIENMDESFLITASWENVQQRLEK